MLPGICLVVSLCLQNFSLAAEEADSIAILKRRAETGLPAAQYQLGNAYIAGDGVPENPAEAAQWFRKASEQGHAEAQFNLGMMYYEGAGVPQDKAEAVKWYSGAAARGVAEAQYNLAVAHSKGEGTPPNQAEAFKWYQTAAEAWDTRAQVQVGLAYRDGIGVQPNETEAIKWLRRAAYQNDPAAQYALGMLYANSDSPNHNAEDAKRWMQRAAELNYGPAVALQTGNATNSAANPGILPQANKSLLARGGLGTIGTNLPANTNLVLSGVSTQAVAIAAPPVGTSETTNALPSDATALPAPAFGQLSEFTNQTKLAEGGSAEAQWSIAMSFLMGEQGEADVEKAIPWLEKAAAQKHFRAEALLRKLNAFRGKNSAPILNSEQAPKQNAPVQTASTPVESPQTSAANTGAKPLGLEMVLMISLGSSVLVIASTAGLVLSLLKSRFARMQQDLLETKLELAEANRSVKKLTTFIQNIENKMLEASLEPPPMPAKPAAKPLPTPASNGSSDPADSRVDFKARRGRSKTPAEGA